MNPQIKSDWISALRSDEYEQGHGYLHVGDKFCCLGVLCDLAVKAGVEVDIYVNHLGDITFYDYESSFLPDSVREWSGLDSHNPVVQGGTGELDSLAGHNDDGKTFNEIADLIENYI